MALHPAEADTSAFVAQCPEIHELANEGVVKIFALRGLQARHWVRVDYDNRAVRDPCTDNSSVPMWWLLPQQRRWYCYLGVFWTAGGKLAHHSENGGWWLLLPPLSWVVLDICPFISNKRIQLLSETRLCKPQGMSRRGSPVSQQCSIHHDFVVTLYTPGACVR